MRIKGSENNYIPTQCFDPICMDKSPHMHCPFCVKTECYTDPVILKAHYRVKHVDKGIEFAGKSDIMILFSIMLFAFWIYLKNYKNWNTQIIAVCCMVSNLFSNSYTSER